MAWDLSILFRRYEQQVRRRLQRAGLRSDQAADIAQDAFLRMAALGERPLDLGTERAARGYLMAIAGNLASDLHRRRRSAPFVDHADEAMLILAQDQLPSAEIALAAKRKLAAVREALEELPERTRKAFELNRMDGLTIAEVGRELGLSTSRAGALVREAYLHIMRSVPPHD